MPPEISITDRNRTWTPRSRTIHWKMSWPWLWFLAWKILLVISYQYPDLLPLFESEPFSLTLSSRLTTVIFIGDDSKPHLNFLFHKLLDHEKSCSPVLIYDRNSNRTENLDYPFDYIVMEILDSKLLVRKYEIRGN